MKKIGNILTVIIVIAVLLRFWSLGSVPSSPDWDEASLGYNAYSLLQTGKDEYGATLPLTLRSFNDYKPGLYAYTIIPFLLLFDLNLLAVRFPSALFGVITVIALFFLVKELFKNEKLALLSSFLLAISPWHIQFSRAGFEANIGLALCVLMTLAFIKGLKSPWFFSVSALLAGLNLYVYQAQKVFTPILVILLVIIYRKEFGKVSKNYLVTAIVIGCIVALPFVSGIISGEALSRAEGTSILKEETPDTVRFRERVAKSNEEGLALGELLNNRRIVFVKQALNAYLSHFNLNWLFITGDNPRHHAPNMGLVYILQLPFLLIGCYALCFYKEQKQHFFKEKLLVFGWLLLSPLPASVTIDTPHAVRALPMVLMLQVLIASGILQAYHLLKNASVIKKYVFVQYVVLLIIFVFALFNFLYFLNQYFVQYNYYFARDWQYGYRETVEYLKTAYPDRPVVVSNTHPLDQSYIFFLFYEKYPPKRYQEEVTMYVEKGDRRGFDRYEFRKLDWSKENNANALYVDAGSNSIPESMERVYEVSYPDGEPAIRILKPRF